MSISNKSPFDFMGRNITARAESDEIQAVTPPQQPSQATSRGTAAETSSKVTVNAALSDESYKALQQQAMEETMRSGRRTFPADVMESWARRLMAAGIDEALRTSGADMRDERLVNRVSFRLTSSLHEWIVTEATSRRLAGLPCSTTRQIIELAALSSLTEGRLDTAGTPEPPTAGRGASQHAIDHSL